MRTIVGTIEAEACTGDSGADLHEVVALEVAALRRWLSGDPGGFLEITAADVVYFDPFTTRRLNGKAELAAYYAHLRGTISALRYEMIDPRVQVASSVAVLTFNFVSWSEGNRAMRWNCTEVYRRDDTRWCIIQTHWSLTGSAG
ncbi:MAG: nuclear transport factor 2 family protein [Aquabacterium sp.]|nr:nuclear transport factor 2 family protein [Aquabacterium sp.]